MSNESTPSISTAANDAADHLKRAADAAVKDGKNKAGVLLDQSGDAMSSAASQAGDAAAELGTRLIDFTKQNPLLALMLAAGAGALVATAISVSSLRR